MVWLLKSGTSVNPIPLHFTETTTVSYLVSPSGVVPALTFRVLQVQPLGKSAHSCGLTSAEWLTLLLNAENKFRANKIITVLDISPTPRLCFGFLKQPADKKALVCSFVTMPRINEIRVFIEFSITVTREHKRSWPESGPPRFRIKSMTPAIKLKSLAKPM